MTDDERPWPYEVLIIGGDLVQLAPEEMVRLIDSVRSRLAELHADGYRVSHMSDRVILMERVSLP